MELANFPESNCVLNPPPGVSLDDCTPACVFRGNDDGGKAVVISCWKLTQAEAAELARTGRIWLWVWGDTMPPVSVVATNPFTVQEGK